MMDYICSSCNKTIHDKQGICLKHLSDIRGNFKIICMDCFSLFCIQNTNQMISEKLIKIESLLNK